MYAGGGTGDNSSYYLYNGQSYWTMSPYNWNETTGYAYVFIVNTGGNPNASNNVNNTGIGLRPVINLKADVTFSGGDGTLNNPYVVQ